jgi:hypothetical protein
LAVAPPAIWGQITLDNFATGPEMIGPLKTGSKTVTQSGAGIVGGSRTVTLTVAAGSVDGENFQQGVTAQVRPSKQSGVPSALIWTPGYNVFSRIDLEYGLSTPLNLNLSSYDRLRVTFDGLSNGLNFNIEVWNGGYSTGDLGCNLSGGYSPSQFTVDFPLADFSSANGGPDWSDISIIDVIFQVADLYPPEMAVTEVSAVPASTPPGSLVCGPSS